MQTACPAWGILINVGAAGTQKPYFILAVVCPSVQQATTQKGDYVQVRMTFKNPALLTRLNADMAGNK